MPLTIKPPQTHPPEHTQHDNSQTLIAQTQLDSGSAISPTAPDFSPITPKVLPALPAAVDAQSTATTPTTNVDHSKINPRDESSLPEPSVPPTKYIPQPPPRPFSSTESSDGLALKAAISSLQFQRQKAQDDIKSLDKIKSLALADPEHFVRELVAGRLKEKPPNFGSLEDVVSAHDAQTSSGTTDSAREGSQERTDESTLPPMPALQDVVRMPHINWDKYHVVGEALDSLHEQQRKWPGSAPFQPDRGRESAVTAPYSPFHDLVADSQKHQHSRNSSDTSKKDSLTSSSLVATPTAIEHPYETRRSSSKYHA